MLNGASGHVGELPAVEVANRRVLAEARVLFAAVALVMSILTDGRSDSLLLHPVLLAYGAYSAVVMWRLAHARAQPAAGLVHWIDALAYTLAVAVSGGMNSEFFVFLLFPILAASVQYGLFKGMAMTLLCSLLFAATALLQRPPAFASVLENVSLGPLTALFLAGLAVSRWGDSETTLMRRLALFNDLNRLVTPSYGADEAIFRCAELLRAYQRADACIVILKDPQSTGCLLYEKDGDGEGRVGPRHIEADLAQALPDLPPDLALLYNARGVGWQPQDCRAYDPVTLETRQVDRRQLSELANLLETTSFISVPVRSRNQTIGRFHLTSQELRYTQNDIRFMAQVAVQAALLIENMQLIEKLFLRAAAQERRRISLDLHDGTIQPYIGLKLGLEALRRRLAMGDPLAPELDDLIRKTTDAINDLRLYVGGLRVQEQEQQRDSLLPALRTQAQRFSDFYGIDVQVMAESDVAVRESLLKEITHIVHEALSNVRRHTAARDAVIRLRNGEGRLQLEFLNESDTTRGPTAFFPRSIGERARELGGRVEVEQRSGRYTAVLVELPV